MRRAFCLTLVAILLICVSALAFTSDEGIEAPTQLVINVGYYGGPYTTKATLSLAELEGMELEEHSYSYINRVSNIVDQYARGVRLSELLKYAGIDTASVNKLHFSCMDVEGDYFLSIDYSTITSSDRCYYPNLRANWDYEKGAPADEVAAMEGATEVPTILALEQYWSVDRDIYPDASMITPDSSFRLCYGMRDVTTTTSYESAKWIHAIDVELYGSPPENVVITGEQLLELTVGSKQKLEANVTGSGEDVVDKVKWSSSDTSVVKVNAEGRITVVGEGEATITVTTVNGLTASVTIRAVAEPVASPTPTIAPTDAPSPSATGGGGGGEASPEPSASVQPTESAAPAPSAAPSASPAPSVTAAPSKTPSPTVSATPRPSATVVPNTPVDIAPPDPQQPETVQLVGYREIYLAGDVGGQDTAETRADTPPSQAEQLAEIQVDKTAQLYAGCGAALLLLLSILYRIIKYRREI